MKKSIHYLVLCFCLILALPFVSMAQVHIGASEYSTVKAAFDAINAGTHTGAITITLSASTTETAQAQLNASGSGSASYTSILMYPTASGVSISGNLSSAIIYLYGADNITIDGRVNQSGAMNMVIENSSASTSACAVYFNNDACSNTFTYINIKASPASTGSYIESGSRGVIYFGSSTSSSGSDNNTISYCNIGPSGSNLPNLGILSCGSTSAGRENSGNVIDHCNIFDYFHDYVNGHSSNTFDAGVYLWLDGNTAWTITNNSFYQTASRNKSNNNTYNNIGAIYVADGDGYIIAGNYIGGTEPLCGGDKMTYTGNAHQFHPIKFRGGGIESTNTTSIYDNEIKNISFTSGNTNNSTNNSVPRFSALHFAQGKLSCYNNIIGSATEQGSIYLQHTNTTFSMYDVWVPAAYSNYIVQVEKCNHNTIAGITMDAPNFDAKGIHVQSYTGNSIDSLCYNTVGSLTQKDNFQICPTTPSVTRSYFCGIYASSVSAGDRIVEGNTVCNITRGDGGTSTLNCIYLFTDSSKIRQNTVMNIEGGNTGVMYGIYCDGEGAIISENYIANLGSSNSSSTSVYGMYCAPYPGANEAYNNVISLGLDADGNSFETCAFRGIYIRYNASLYHNTSVITGISTAGNSYAIFDYSNAARTINDNIFCNNRTNASGSAKHYAVYYYSTSGLTSDYNNFFVSGSGGVLGYRLGDRTTLAAIQSATGQDANSVNQDPNFYNPIGNYASDYMLISSLNGNTVAGITTDFGGTTRNPTPTMGAWEYKAFIWVGTINTDFGTAGNWQDNEVPPCGASIEFAASPVNHCILDQDRIVADISNDQTTYDLLVNGHSLCVRGQLNFTNDAEIEASASGSTVNFCGSQAQTIPANAFYKDTIYNLNINNSANLTTNSDLHVQNGMTFTNGKLITGSNMLVLEDDVNLSGVSSDSYVVGTVRKKGNDSFVFPIGNDSIYTPIAISAPAVSTDVFTASYFHANPNPLYSISSLGTGIDHVSSNEYWILDRTGGLSNVAVTLTWNEYSGISDLADLRVARWDGSEWNDEGNSGTSGTTVSGSIISNTVTSFSPFTLGSFTSGNPLPVEYFDMSAVSSDDGILIDWSTASETNNDYFVVEKSLDSHVWSEIAFVRGAGNSNMIENYNALDVNPVKGLQYYRIAQNDFNGQISYSKTLSVIWEEAVDVSLYPNPATNAMIINFASSDNTVVTVQIMNTLGKTVKTIQQVGNMSSIDISDLSPGVYYMDFPGSNNLKKCRFIKK